MNSAAFIHQTVESTFGPTVASVARILLARGPSTLSDLQSQFTDVSSSSIKRSLMILIQHELVSASYEKFDRPNHNPSAAAVSSSAPLERSLGVKVLYIIFPDRIRYRNYFPLYVDRISALFGRYGDYLIQTVAGNGQLTKSQILEITFNSLKSKEPTLEKPEYKIGVHKEIDKTFERIKQSEYIIPARVLPVNVREAAEKNQRKQKRKREADLIKTKSRGRKIAKTNAAAAPAQEESDDSESDEDAEEAQIYESNVTSSEPVNPPVDVELSAADQLWSLNHRLFLDDFRRAEVQEFVDRKFSPSHSWIIRGILQNAGKSNSIIGGGNNKSNRNKASASIRELLIWLESQPSAPRLTALAIENYLTEMRADSASFIDKESIAQAGGKINQQLLNRNNDIISLESIINSVTSSSTSSNNNNNSINNNNNNNSSSLSSSAAALQIDSAPQYLVYYSINFPHFFHDRRLRELQFIAKEKFNPLAARVFRLLIENKLLEETQIAEKATAPRKNIREVLYAMLKSQLIHLQEIPRSADRQPTRTFFLWGIKPRKAIESGLDMLYFTAKNLRIRLDEELNKIKPLMDKVEMEKLLTEEEQLNITKWKKGADRMESALINVQKLIMIFKDC